jgi:hypothetical protein
MRESAKGIIKLPEDEAAIFSQVLHFVYHSKLEYDVQAMWRNYIENTYDTKLKQQFNETSVECIKIYILAQKLGTEALQNWLIDCIRTLLIWRYFSAEEMNLILSSTLPDDALVRLSIDPIAHDLFKLDWDEWVYQRPMFCRGFIKEDHEVHEMITKAVVKKRAIRAPWNYTQKTACRQYHVHEKEEACKELVALNRVKASYSIPEYGSAHRRDDI